MTNKAFILLSVLALVLSCTKPEQPEDGKVEFPETYVEVNSRSADISVLVKIPSGTDAMFCGVAVSTLRNPESDPEAITRQTKISTGDKYTFNVTGIEPETEHCYQPFAILADESVIYGETGSFTTLAAKMLEGHEFVNLGMSSDTKWAVFNMELDGQSNHIAWDSLLEKVSEEWGSDWRLPSREDWEELMEECFWSWDIQKGMQGMLVKGPNGNTIFLPADGYMAQGNLMSFNDYGAYWTSDMAPSNPGCSWCLFFGMDFVYWNPLYQICQASVRPVSNTTIYDY